MGLGFLKFKTAMWEAGQAVGEFGLFLTDAAHITGTGRLYKNKVVRGKKPKTAFVPKEKAVAEEPETEVEVVELPPEEKDITTTDDNIEDMEQVIEPTSDTISQEETNSTIVEEVPPEVETKEPEPIKVHEPKTEIQESEKESPESTKEEKVEQQVPFQKEKEVEQKNPASKPKQAKENQKDNPPKYTKEPINIKSLQSKTDHKESAAMQAASIAADILNNPEADLNKRLASNIEQMSKPIIQEKFVASPGSKITSSDIKTSTKSRSTNKNK